MNAHTLGMIALATTALLAGSAMGQATLYITPVGTDITPDGNKLVGPLYDAAAAAYWAHVLDRTTNTHTYHTDRELQDVVFCNADATALASTTYDLENLAGFGTDRTIAHVRVGAANWFNIGPSSNAFKCDFSVNSAYAIARNTNEVLMNGWTDRLCGPFRSWIFNPADNSFTQLPTTISAPPLLAAAKTARGNSISDDGLTVCGWDENWNANFSATVRKSCVWRKVNGSWTQVILDNLGGSATRISGDGNTVIGKNASGVPVRWVRSGNTWTSFPLGGSNNFQPYWVSFDGNTIVGDLFIWRPTLNEGVAMSLDTFFATQGLDTFGIELGGVGGSTTQGLSGDGNSIILLMTDHRNPCLTQFIRAVVDINGRPCQQPVVVFDPQNYTQQGPLGDPHFPGYYGVILNAFVAGTADMHYQWQKETAPGVWTDLVDDNCDQFSPNFFDVKNATGSQLRLGNLSGATIYAGSYRCVATNDCGSATSQPAIVTAFCPADFDGDGTVDFFDYDAFVTCFEGGACPPGKTADFDGDGSSDFFDYDAFVVAFEAPC